MKKVSRRELARTIAKQLLDGKDQKRLMQELAAYLIEHKMVHQFNMLIDDIAIELERVTGHTSATVRSAFALSDATQQGISDYLKAATSAKSVELSVIEDRSLLAGVIIRTPEREYDSSARHKLNQLARGDV